MRSLRPITMMEAATRAVTSAPSAKRGSAPPFAIVAATGDIYAGLRYPVAIATMTLIVGALFLKETKDVDIVAQDGPPPI